jgi:hypothetical protein
MGECRRSRKEADRRLDPRSSVTRRAVSRQICLLTTASGGRLGGGIITVSARPPPGPRRSRGHLAVVSLSLSGHTPTHIRIYTHTHRHTHTYTHNTHTLTSIHVRNVCLPVLHICLWNHTYLMSPLCLEVPINHHKSKGQPGCPRIHSLECM